MIFFQDVASNSLVAQNSRTPEEIDQTICDEIDALTKENNAIWSSPNHYRRNFTHGFFQYPAMMVPIVQRILIEIVLRSKPDIRNVLDAFMGSGTALVACMEKGLNCYGQDVNPLAVLVAKTRTGASLLTNIIEESDLLIERIKADSSTAIEANFNNLDKWFKREVSVELSKIVRAIREEQVLEVRRFFWVILAETVRVCSNDRTSTFKLHIRTSTEIEARNISPIDLFTKHLEKCHVDLNEYLGMLSTEGTSSSKSSLAEYCLNLLDSKNKVYVPFNDHSFFDLHVTSPPYGDNKTTVTYGQHSFLPLQWIDLKDIDERATPDLLTSTSQIDTLGLGGRILQLSEIDLNTLFVASPTLRKTYHEIYKKDPKKSKKVVSFFFDIYRSIFNIHSAMKINGYQIWTVGNRTVAGIEIPNNIIMSDFICSHGSILVKKLNREILNRRMASRNRSATLMTFEEILIFRKIG